MTTIRVTRKDGTHDDYNLNRQDIEIDSEGTIEVFDPFWTESITRGNWTTLEVLND